jgi:DNA repair exonuclease SbcCD nuclease subunit
MRIAITADLHLTTREYHPERYETLENLLADLCANEIDMLIIAGDLFDAHSRSYAEFEQLCRDEQNRGLSIYIIPGNHDPTIDDSKISAGSLHIVTTPTIHEIDGRTFFFLPYQGGKTMGEALAQFESQLPANEWVLIGHGDWTGGLRQPNPTEPGVYMPLTRRDIEIFKPARVFLGHIHAKMDAPPVHYVGSPCGLDITETGRRRCLIYDANSNEVEERVVETPILYFNESFVVIPAKDEEGYLRAQIEGRRKKWALSAEERARVRLRVNVSGYSANRAALRTLLRDAFDGFAFYKNQEPNIDQVSISDDVERHYIAEQVRAGVEDLSLPGGTDEPSSDDILLAALHIIYGG